MKIIYKKHSITRASLVFTIFFFSTGFSVKKIIDNYPSKDQGTIVSLQVEEHISLKVTNNQSKIPILNIIENTSTEVKSIPHINKPIICQKVYISTIIWRIRELTKGIIGDNSNLLYTKPWVDTSSSEILTLLCDKTHLPESVTMKSKVKNDFLEKGVFEIWKTRLNNQINMFCQPVKVNNWVWKLRRILGFNNKLNSSHEFNTSPIQNQQTLLCFKKNIKAPDKAFGSKSYN
jgi:hypothetical protein